MQRPYSRLARVEEKRNIRKAVLYVILSIVSLVLLVIFGIPALVKMAAFLTGLNQSGTPVEINDTTPPAPARFDTVPEYTNRQVLEVKGFAEPGATIRIFANNRTDEVIVNNEGYFLYDFSLNKGENTISAVVVDQAGNESQNSGETKIIQDDEAPTIEITTPEDGRNFYGSNQRQITIEGNVSGADDLMINGRFVTIEDSGNFIYSVTLQEGENNFEIVAKDLAGNETIARLTVTFWK